MGKANLELDRCMSCGLCLDDCPTYKLTGRSTSSPRGRIRLMKNLSERAINLTDIVPYTNVSVRHELETCLGCLGCDTSCPADIRYSEMYEGLQITLFQQDPEYKKQIEELLRDLPVDNHPKMRALMILLFILQRTGANWIVKNTPLIKLLPAKRKSMLQLLSKRIPVRPSSKRLAKFNPAIGKRKMRVGALLGCITDHMFAETNIAMVRLLQRMGADVIVPESQACCGAIHQHMGDHETSKQMAIENSRRFLDLDVDTIAVNAAGCGSWIKEYAHALPDHPVVQEIGPKFRDIHEIIWQLLETDPKLMDEWIWPGKRETYTYHDACHHIHGQGISETPRILLQHIQGLEFVPMNESSLCCGSAGTYNIFQPELAQEILDRKIMNIRDTQARIVAVANPGCTLQILSGLKGFRKSRIKCYHPLELIDMSWRST